MFNRFRGTIDHWDPALLDVLASRRDVVVFDNVGVGFSDGEPRATAGGYADGALEFIDGLGLAAIDLFGWSFGGAVVQVVNAKRSELVRRMIVAGSGPGTVPNLPPTPSRVVEIMSRQNNSFQEQRYLFYPQTPAAEAAAVASARRIAKRLGKSNAEVSEIAAQRQASAIGAFFREGEDNGVWDSLPRVKKPVLYANGAHDVMIHAYASYAAVERLPNAVLIIYSDAGHAFLFQHAEDFGNKVLSFLEAESPAHVPVTTKDIPGA